MNLLGCSSCRHRFYANGVDEAHGLWCPHCGGSLKVVTDHITSIPLDARWLGRRLTPEPPTVTVVDLRLKRGHGWRSSRRIIKGLSDYFDVHRRDGLVKVGVDRGPRESATLRVAAVLDGVDGSWEEHFYLPTTDSEPPPPGPSPPIQHRGLRGHLRLAESPADEQGSA